MICTGILLYYGGKGCIKLIYPAEAEVGIQRYKVINK